MKNIIYSILGISDKIQKLESDKQKLQDKLDSIKAYEQGGDFPRKHIYTDKFGNNYYSYVGNDMPNIRKGIVMSQIESMRFGIEPEPLIDSLGELATDTANLSPKNVDKSKRNIILELSKLQEKTAYILQPNLYLKTAMCMVLLEGEPDEYDDEWAKKKEGLWKKDINAQYFFLCEVGIFLNESLNWSPTSVAKYLNDKGLKVEQFRPTV